MRGADGAVGAASAYKSLFGGKTARANIGGDFLYDFLRFLELLGAARGFLTGIVLQIMKDETRGVQFENFFKSLRASVSFLALPVL